MNKCIKCGRYTNQIFCDYCKQEIQKEIEKPNLNKFHKKYDNQKVWKCENGINVRSQGERTIADFLFTNNIPFEYEVECRYGEYNPTTQETTGKFIVPDFYIKGPIYFKGRIIQEVYIEFWGKNDKEYLKRKEIKTNVYNAHKATLINIYPKDLQDYKESLTYKLLYFCTNQINY